MPQTKPIVSIENVVASATVNQKMDLNEITKKFPDVEYHPEQFPGLVFRIRSPKTATLIFSSGKMVCTGAKSESMSRTAVKTVVDANKATLEDAGYGLSALKTLIDTANTSLTAANADTDSIIATLGDATNGLAAINTNITTRFDTVDATLSTMDGKLDSIGAGISAEVHI